MLEKDFFGYLTFVAECDGDNCHYDDYTDCDDLYEAINHLKSYGWKIKKIDGDWCHFCPLCANKY